MKISMYAMSHDVFRKSLQQLVHVMEKGVASAKARGFDPNLFLTTRLAPDMLPFSKQIQIASDFAKSTMARLAGVEPPKFEDTETTMDELIVRVKKTLDYIDTVPASSLEGSEERDITIPLRDRTLQLKGLPYLQHWSIPNFYFHVVTAYALLRHNGVDVGKRDFLGG